MMKTNGVIEGKSSDGFILRNINRKLSINIFSPLILRIHKGVTPNQVTLLSFFTSVFGGILFFLLNPLIGGIVVQLASILDGSDGEIARYKKMTSTTGNYIDSFLDRYADLFIFSGVFYYVYIHITGNIMFGIYFSLPITFFISVLAIFGMLMSEWMILKSRSNFNYDPRDHWMFYGRRDLRLFIIFIGGILTYFHVFFVFLALVIVAIETNFRSVGRFIITLRVFEGDENYRREVW